MKKILTTVYLSGAILFGTCVAEGAQNAASLDDLAGTVRSHISTIRGSIDDNLNAGKTQEETVKEIKGVLPDAASAFNGYRNAFFKGKDVDPLKYAKENRDNAYDEYVKLFGEFSGVIKEIIAKKYFWREDLDEILRNNGASLRSLGLKNCLDLYCVFIASRYLNSIDDHINLIESSSKFQGNLEKFHYNPVTLDKTTREFFPNLQTLYRYSEDDENFDNDGKIKAREVWYPYKCKNDIDPNTTYRRDVILTKEYIQNRFANAKNISIKDWPKINGKVVLDDLCFSGIDLFGAVELPNYITRLGKECFQSKAFCKISPPTFLKAIDASAFSSCGMRKITLPEGLMRLPDGGFEGCSALISISIPTKVMSIGRKCFMDCHSLSSIEIPPLVTRLEWGTFYNCSRLQDVKLPKNLSVIDDSAFFGCRNLTRLTLPSSLLKVGCAVFGLAGNLTIVNESAVPLKVSEFGVKVVENAGLANLRGLDTERLIRMLKVEDAFDTLSHLGSLLEPLKPLVRDVFLIDPTKIDGSTAREINSVRTSLSKLSKLSCLTLLADFNRHSELSKLSGFSVLSELKGK